MNNEEFPDEKTSWLSYSGIVIFLLAILGIGFMIGSLSGSEPRKEKVSMDRLGALAKEMGLVWVEATGECNMSSIPCLQDGYYKLESAIVAYYNQYKCNESSEGVEDSIQILKLEKCRNLQKKIRGEL